MPLDTQQKTIDNLDVRVTEFAGTRCLDTLSDLAVFIGPSLSAALSTPQTLGLRGPQLEGAGNTLDNDINLAAVADSLTKKISADGVRALVFKLLASTFVNDRPVVDHFDEIFAGKKLLKRLPAMLLFVIEVNYGNFSDLARNVSGLTESVSQPQKALAN